LEVRASLALSYRGQEEARRLFRLLGLLDAPSFPAWTAAALLDVEPARAEGLLERLVDAQLVDEAGEDQAGQLRYRLHDLLRVYARERLDSEERARHARGSRACRPVGRLTAPVRTRRRRAGPARGAAASAGTSPATNARWPASPGPGNSIGADVMSGGSAST
jgi:hypothetical protein